jgi:hypothetical protein
MQREYEDARGVKVMQRVYKNARGVGTGKRRD